MKKLMIALAAVAMAAGVQAASYNWSVNEAASGFTKSQEEYANENCACGMGYFFVEGVNGVTREAVLAAIEAGTFVDSFGAKALDSIASIASSGTVKNSFPEGEAVETYPNYEGSKAFAVIVADKATEYETGKVLEEMENPYAYITDYVTIGAQPALGGANVAFGNVFDETSSAGAWTVQGVPEPTSGLLLLLGVAGLALRRRRA